VLSDGMKGTIDTRCVLPWPKKDRTPRIAQEIFLDFPDSPTRSKMLSPQLGQRDPLILSHRGMSGEAASYWVGPVSASTATVTLAEVLARGSASLAAMM
jgi:hypothetical protein